MSTATLEQPIAQRREIARLFIPKFPVPLCLSDKEGNERWLNWLLFVRRFAVLEHVCPVDRAFRVEATVTRWEGGRSVGPLVLETWLDRWEHGLYDGLTRAPLCHPNFLFDIAVRYESLPMDTELLDRPKREGVHIVFIEEDDPWSTPSC